MALKLNPTSAPAYQEFAQVMIDCLRVQGVPGLLTFVADCERAIDDWKLAQAKPTVTFEQRYCELCGDRQHHTPSGWVCRSGHGGADHMESTPMAKPAEFALTSDQTKAWDLLRAWVATDAPFFVLKGFAGTGKSFMMKKLLELNLNLYFSAPTNKATAVLEAFIGEACKTTYSLLGLRMEAEDDKLVLKVKSLPKDMGVNPILVIDEAGMIPKVVADIIKMVCKSKGWRAILVGDPAQLNPIGEERSEVWDFAPKKWRVLLREVKRFDNQLLKLSIAIRDRMKNEEYESPIVDDHDADGGIHVLPSRRSMLGLIGKLTLEDWDSHKVVCWRNRTVDQYNKYIRNGLGFSKQYEIGERILLASPLVSGQSILAHTDEEFTVISVEDRNFSYPEGTLACHSLALKDFEYRFYVPKDEGELQRLLNMRVSQIHAASGYEKKKMWGDFWDLKNTFQSIRYGYALTCHRLQGSTVTNIFVDQSDILANPNALESFRCLYVAATRPQKHLFTY